MTPTPLAPSHPLVAWGALVALLGGVACAGSLRGGYSESVVPVTSLDSIAAATEDVPSLEVEKRHKDIEGVVSADMFAQGDTIRRCRTVRTATGQQVVCALIPSDTTKKTVPDSLPLPVASAQKVEDIKPSETPSSPKEVATRVGPKEDVVDALRVQIPVVALPDATATSVIVPAPEAPTPIADTRATRDTLPPVTVSFLQDPLADVLSLFSAHSGRSIIASDAADVANKKISGDIRDQPWREALRLLMRSHSMRLVEDSASGVLSVVSESQSLSSCQPRVVRLEYAYAEDIVPVMQELMGIPTGEDGAVRSQEGCDRVEVVKSGNKDGRSSTFVIFMTDDRLEEMMSLISQLDVRKPLVGIQVRMVFVNRSRLEKFGWQYTLTNQNNALNNNNGANNGLTGVQVSPIGGNFGQTGNNNTAGGGTGRPFTILQSLALGGATSLNVFVEAMQSVGLAQTDAQPMIVTQSESTANISVGEFFILPQSQPLLAGGIGGVSGTGANGQNQGVGTVNTGVGGQVGPIGTTPGGGGVGVTNQGLSNPAFGFAQFQTGTVLKVTPQVLKTGEIRVDVEVSRDGGNLGSSGQGLSGARQFAATNVIVKNGQDIPIGGMRVLSRSTTKGGVPVLGSIPLLGRLFRTNEEAELFQDLMIIVTPTVID